MHKGKTNTGTIVGVNTKIACIYFCLTYKYKMCSKKLCIVFHNCIEDYRFSYNFEYYIFHPKFCIHEGDTSFVFFPLLSFGEEVHP